MAEIITLRWPDEVKRFIDPIDETPVTERQISIFGDEAVLFMGDFKSGRFKRADLSLEKTTDLCLDYTFTRSFAGISGSYLTSDLGMVEYDKDGYICKVELQPVERLEARFWRECVPEKDNEIIKYEEIARQGTFRDLQNEYGIDGVPLELIVRLDELCTTTKKYYEKLQKFISKEVDKGPVIVRHNRAWHLEPVKPIKGVEPIPIHWGEWVIYRGEAICVDILNDEAQKKFRFRQIAATGNNVIESKSETVPRRIDYDLCRRLVHTKNSWQNIFSIYPVELEFYNNSLMGKSG